MPGNSLSFKDVDVETESRTLSPPLTMTQSTTDNAPPPYDQATGQLGIAVVADPHSDDVLVTLTPPKDGQRVPADICCVIDVSGSMTVNATLPSVGGMSKMHRLRS